MKSFLQFFINLYIFKKKYFFIKAHDMSLSHVIILCFADIRTSNFVNITINVPKCDEIQVDKKMYLTMKKIIFQYL